MAALKNVTVTVTYDAQADTVTVAYGPTTITTDSGTFLQTLIGFQEQDFLTCVFRQELDKSNIDPALATTSQIVAAITGKNYKIGG